MVLNEPETEPSSRPAHLLRQLARLIARAAKRSQIIIVSHAAALVSDLPEVPQARRISAGEANGRDAGISIADESPELDLAVAVTSAQCLRTGWLVAVRSG